MINKITNPISTNQVTEVSLLKPSCADFCGNTLNDWLKWLAEKQCEVNWKNVDTTCLDNYYKNPCEKTLKTIIEQLITAVCTLQTTTGSECCSCGTGGGGSSSSETVEELELAQRWFNVNATDTAKAYLKDGWVKLSGRINGGSILNPIATLALSSFKPTFERRVPFAFAFNMPNVVNEHPFLKIDTSGVISIVWVGTSPSSTLNGDVYFDGIQFKI